MAEEIELEPDYRSISRGELEVFPLPPRATIPGGPPCAMLTVNGIRVGSPVVGNREPYEVDVTVEYRPEEISIEPESFGNYLRTYNNAQISQDTMTKMVRRDIEKAVGTEEVFVELHRKGFVQKKTRTGSV